MKVLILLTILLALSSCENKELSAGALDTKETKKVIPIEITDVRLDHFVAHEEYFGKVHAVEEMNMITHAGGLVGKITTESGDSVKLGQKLCDIDGEKFQTQLEMAKLSEKVSKNTWDRLQAHLKSGRSSQLNVDKAKLDYLNAKKDRISAEKSYNEAFCIAPFDGIVTSVQIQSFENLNPGAPTVSLANLSKVKIKIEIPESSLNETHKGSKADVLIPNTGTWTESTIASIDQKINFNNKKFDGEIILLNKDNLLKPGMTVKTRVESYNVKDKVVIPSTAIITLTDGQAVVLAENGKAIRRSIKVIANNGALSLVSEGIEPGEKLIVKGQSQVVDGSPIQIVNDPNKKGKS